MMKAVATSPPDLPRISTRSIGEIVEQSGGGGVVSDTPGFASDIKPLFRQKDRESMESAFDLWDYKDVKESASDILRVLEAGEMPCDGPWPAEQVALFRSWVETGMPE
jgi:hypothetical protein